MSKEVSKMPMKRIVNNCLYILKIIFREAKIYYSCYFILRTLSLSIFNVISVFMMKFLIESVNRSFYDAVHSIALLCGIICMLIILTILTEKSYEIKTEFVINKIQCKILQKASDIDLIYYDNKEFYDDLVRALERGENQIAQCIMLLVNIVSCVTNVGSITILIMTIDPLIALFPIAACIVNIISLLLIKKNEYNMNMEVDMVKRKRRYAQHVFYHPIYAKEVKLTNIKERIIQIFEKSIIEEQAIVKNYGLKSILVKMINYVLGWTICVYYFPPLYMIYNTIVLKKMSVGDLSATHNANTNIFYTLSDISNKLMELQNVGLYAESLRKFMEFNTGIEDSKGDMVPEGGPYVLEVKNLTYRYDYGSMNVLKNISFKVNPREKIAIVGKNGSGKSTLIKSLLHLYEATEGGVFYKEKNINAYDTRQFRKLFNVIFQDFQIYACSLKDNILMGKQIENENDVLYNALKVVSINDSMGESGLMPDTQLTREFYSEGAELSGGEKQKIAIARLFVHERPIIIMDEASSALDAKAEHELNEKLLNGFPNSTVIVISHRLTTTCMADKIYMLNDGRIIEEGSHEDLMKCGGEYAKMFQKQAQYYL